MESFDDFISEQLLNELGGDFSHAIGKKVSRKVGSDSAWADTLKAKVGSKTATGRLALRNQIHTLEDDFAQFCGEQSLNRNTATVEDFLEFLKHRVKFNFPQEMFDRLAYGSRVAGKEAPHNAQIEALHDEIEGALRDSKNISVALQGMKQIAQSGDADEVGVRKSLWKLARENPSQISKFSQVSDLVGRPLKSFPFRNLVTQIAMVVIKHTNSKDTSHLGGEKETNAAEQGSPKLDTLEVGIVPAFNPSEMRAPMRCEDFLKALSECNLDQSKLASQIKLVRQQAEKNPADLEKFAESFQHGMSFEQLINANRIILQAFRSPGLVGHLQEPFLDRFTVKDTGSGGTAEEVKRDFGQKIKSLLNTRLTPDPEDRSRGTYDATAFNKSLSNIIRTKEAASRAFVCLLDAMGQTFGGAK